ncbi:MAG: PadR family transcriptional regulator [Clostridia bacterium]|nr:PadR family transcriptional regulator [Clostridia bacterium]
MIDLIILGMLIEKSQSAYDIQKDIEYHNFDRWSKISIPSIYKKVIQLEEKGYLVSEIINSGRLINKAIYSITEKGRKYFQTLMTDLSMTNPSVIFDFNILIANITKLPRSQGQVLLSNLKIAISQALSSTEEWEKEFSNMPFNGQAIIKQQIAVYKLLLEWVNEFEKQYASQ